MAKSASEILSMFGISLRSAPRHGNQKARCPRCSHTRKHKKDPCLSIKVDDKGVCWHCHNCGWDHAVYYEASGSSYTGARQAPATRGYQRLHASAAASWVPQRA